MPTYPLDRRILELIVKKAKSSIDLDCVEQTTTGEYIRIAEKISYAAFQKGLKVDMHYQTLKRVFGHTKTKEGMRCSNKTLEAIAYYLGCDGWNKLISNLRGIYKSKIINPEYARSFGASSIVAAKDELAYVKPNNHVTIKWIKGNVDAEVSLECVELRTYRVYAVKNASLQYGDILKGVDCYYGFPLRAKELIRTGCLTQRYEGIGIITEVLIEKTSNK